MSDMKQWGVLDRWSSPLETLTTGRGDCEDYAIVKYVALLGAGVHRQDVKVVVLRDLLRNEDHAITVTRIGEKWIVLDNRWLALVQDVEVRRVVPLFILDHTGVRAYVSNHEQRDWLSVGSRLRLNRHKVRLDPTPQLGLI